MMRNWIYIALLACLLPFGGTAQVLTPLSNGLNKPGLTGAAGEQDLIILSTNEDGILLPVHWDGKIWSEGQAAVGLKPVGISSEGELKVISNVVWQNILYVLTAQRDEIQDNFTFNIWKYSNNIWSEISDVQIREALEINELLVFQGKLTAVGRSNKDTPSNLFVFDNNLWQKKGNYLTPDVSKDYIIDAEVYGSKIYISGVFTKIGSSDKRYLAEWDGSQWNFMLFPPFVHQSYAYGKFNDKLVLHGKPATGNQAIRVFNGSSWEDLSKGLENIAIQIIHSFAYTDEFLFACGSFTKGSQQSSILYYHNDLGWNLGDEQIFNASLKLLQFGKSAVMTGDYKILHNEHFGHVSTLSARNAILRGAVFEDLNGNCIKDKDENPKANITLVLQPGNFHFNSDANGEFEIPVNTGTYTIRAIAPKHWNTSCQQEVSVNAIRSYGLLNLGITPLAGKADVQVKMTDFSGWKVATEEPNKYRLCAKNVGTVQMESGKLIFRIPQELTNITYQPVPDYLDAGRAEWFLSNVASGQEVCVEITAGLKPGLDPAKKVSINSSVEWTGNTDADLSDNETLLDQEQTTYLQSNAKASSLNGNYQSDQKPLHYRILFQNQSGKTVQKLKIVDTLDKDISISSKGIIESTSHSSKLSYDYILLPNGNYQYVLIWEFANMNLIDSSLDELNSKGYADLQIFTDLRFMKQGSEICNNAYFWFENSEPFRTNSVCTNVGNIGYPRLDEAGIKLIPNPSNGYVQLTGDANNAKFSILQANGLVVYKGTWDRPDQWLDLSALSSGIYIFQMEGFAPTKIILAH